MKPDRKSHTFILVLIGLAAVLAACSVGPAQEAPGKSPATLPSVPARAPEQDRGGAEAGSGATGEVDVNCTQTNPHPIGQSIADTYDFTYEEVMTWFCSGNPFDDILVALETSAATDVAIDVLLEMRKQDKSWDEIWEQIGFIERSGLRMDQYKRN